jgi:hypothetical protein
MRNSQQDQNGKYRKRKNEGKISTSRGGTKKKIKK